MCVCVSGLVSYVMCVGCTKVSVIFVVKLAVCVSYVCDCVHVSKAYYVCYFRFRRFL